MREPKAVTQAIDDGYAGFENVQNAGQILLMNNGVEVDVLKVASPPFAPGSPTATRVATKTPTSSETVRQAIAAAINPETIDQRENDGTGIPTTALFDESFPWDPGVAGPEYDLDRGLKSSVVQAKSEGWDGKGAARCATTHLLHRPVPLPSGPCSKRPASSSRSRTTPDVSGTIGAVITRKDYDLACRGLSVPGDDGAVFQVGYFFVSNGAANRTGYKNPEMDAALKQLRAASTDDERRSADEEIAQLYTEDVPMLSLQAIREYIAWDDSVHGVVPNQGTQVFLDKTWIAVRSGTP